MPAKPHLDIQELKKKTHHLKPVIIIGTNGLTEAVLCEIEIALNAHELIKIKINGTDRDSRHQVTHSICEMTKSRLIKAIGNIIVIYRKRPDK